MMIIFFVHVFSYSGIYSQNMVYVLKQGVQNIKINNNNDVFDRWKCDTIMILKILKNLKTFKISSKPLQKTLSTHRFCWFFPLLLWISLFCFGQNIKRKRRSHYIFILNNIPFSSVSLVGRTENEYLAGNFRNSLK